MREGIVAGLEPFIDTLVVCTLTAMVILSTGIWNREPGTDADADPHRVVRPVRQSWSFTNDTIAGVGRQWLARERQAYSSSSTLMTIRSAAMAASPGRYVSADTSSGASGLQVEWNGFASDVAPRTASIGAVYETLVGATLTARAFDSVTPGLGKWLVTLASWLFAISTMISWSYYGEQGMVLPRSAIAQWCITR